jgi:aminoglycoside 3-N-acetyltransferase
VISREQLHAAAEELDLADRPVVVHASLRSFGVRVDGDTLLDTLLSLGCTVMVPSFTEPQFGVAPPPSMCPPRNGIDYANPPVTAPRDEPYTVDCGLVNNDLGTFPKVVLARRDVERGHHPLNSFASVGPLAADLVGSQQPADVYGPIRELATRDGRILLIGVGLNRMTAIHLAEQQSGRRLFQRWARDTDGATMMAEVGSCSEGFPCLEPTLRALADTTRVGSSTWRAFPAQETLAAATTAIAADQSITHCPDPVCRSCVDATAGGPLDLPPLGGPG